MDNKPYLAQCIDSKYDEEDEMLVLFCLFKDLGEPRIVCFHRSDFHFKEPHIPVPHNEMYRTADLWKGKNFQIIIEDDPNRVKVDESNQAKYIEMFRERVSEELKAVQEGMQDDKRILQRYVGDLVEREKKKKQELDVDQMISEESVIRQRLSSVRTDN